MSDFVIDVESDGPVPPRFSMVCFGAVLVSDRSKTFYGKTKPISDNSIDEALAVSGFTREEHETFEDPDLVMMRFADWIESVNVKGRPIFWSDNVAYDWQWINYYFHEYTEEDKNPFGFSGRRIGDLYCGHTNNMSGNANWKRKLRKTRHDHNPVNDAIGNAEALETIIKMIKKTKTGASNENS